MTPAVSLSRRALIHVIVRRRVYWVGAAFFRLSAVFDSARATAMPAFRAFSQQQRYFGMARFIGMALESVLALNYA